jgi:hypothetical protein
MATNDNEVWCGNAYLDETPLELADTPHCDAIGTELVTDPNGGWSGAYCSSCTAILLAAGWSQPDVTHTSN